MYKRCEQDTGMSEPCRLNEASHHLLDSCILSGNVVKLPLMCQTDIQKTTFCVGDCGLLRTIVLVVLKSIYLIPICVQMSELQIHIFVEYGVGFGKRICED